MKPTLTLLCTLLFTLFIAKPLQACCYTDYVAPVAICDAHTVVSLSNDGSARVYATDIDDGSYDNCHIAQYKVRRMSPGWCPYPLVADTQFRPYVEFCCEDVGHTIWVVMRVIDDHGNYNECMAEVTVQDNSAPHINCPPNITISCGFYFNDDCLYNPYNHTFGTCNGSNCSPIIINDPGNNSCNQPYNWGCDGYAGGGCGGGNMWVNICDVIDYRNSCGVGIIKRKFCVENGYWSDYCWQTITVKDFSHSSYYVNWPPDYVADACLYTVDDVNPNDIPPPYNKPVIPGYDAYSHSCSLIGIAHEDLVFTFDDGACKKILRTWTVIDWCKYQPNNPWTQGIWTHVQVIKLMNAHPPYFVNSCPEHVVVDGYEPYCSGRYIDYPNVHDDCTPTEGLKWDWKLDLNNDGSYDISGVGEGQPYIDKVLPDGWHKILWNIGDACGNFSTCSHKIHVIDKKAPTPVCYYGLSTVVMPLGGMVTIWAKDFNASSYDNCTPGYKLKFSFSSNPYDASRVFTCDDIGTVPLQIWAFDEYGNKDYCTTYIKIQDNAGTCPPMHPVTGSVSTFSNIGVPHASAAMSKIMPNQTLDEEYNATSDATGHFEMGFGTTQFDRMITMSRDGKPLEGISTLDLIALKRHIDGTQPITEPYKLYAADLDGNGRVGANDLLLLRNALFGAYQLPDYAGNLSWVFFGDPCNPNTPEDLYNNYCHPGVEVNHSGTFPASVEFKAIKMGDVNGDMVNTAWLLAPRTKADFEIYTKTNEVTGALDFILSKDAQLYGFQMSLKIDGLNLIEGAVPVSSSNLVVDKDGISRISWGQSNPVMLKKGEVLFSLNNLPANTTLDQLLMVDEESLYPEVYTQNLQNQKIELLPFDSGKPETRFETKLSPNPFSDITTLSVIIPAGEEFRVSLFNMKGQELFNRKYISYTNKAEINIDNDMIQTPGIYYYKVISTIGELSGKFVKQ